MAGTREVKWLPCALIHLILSRLPASSATAAGWFEEVARPRLRGNCQLVRFADDWPLRSSCLKTSRSRARPRLRGNCQLVRFADDFVIALEDCHSGKQLLDVLGKRLGRYGLTLHEAKTRHVDFHRSRPYGRHWTASANRGTPLDYGTRLQNVITVSEYSAMGFSCASKTRRRTGPYDGEGHGGKAEQRYVDGPRRKSNARCRKRCARSGR